MKQKLLTFFSILLGNALLAFAVCAFVVPNGFILGGSNGIALALHSAFPFMPLSLLNGMLNGALFFLGLGFLGKKFAAGTLLSTVIYPVFMAVFEQLPVDTLFTEDKLTCAIFCAAMAGFGIGIVVRSGGATGGMDIPPCILHKFKGIPVGTSMLVFDTAIVLAQVLLNGLDGILYSLMIIFVMSVTINQTVVTGVKKVQLIVISPQYQRIRREIIDCQDGGVTMLDIETGYEGSDQKAVLCILYAKRYPAIRDAILQIDPHAFIITSEVKNVNGQGYTLARMPDKNI